MSTKLQTQVDPVPLKQIRCWLSETIPDTRPQIRHNMIRSCRGDDNAISFEHLTEKERQAFEAFEIGQSYLRIINGRLHAYHVHEPLPGPEPDPLMAPHWPSDGTIKQFGGPPRSEGWHMPGIHITALGAGSRSDDERKRSQDTLIECGFICLRSPRGDDGRHWEQWVLHFMNAAKGRLADHMKGWRGTNKKHDWWAEVEEAARYITRDLNVHYGSLDITIQRWALGCGDD